MPTKGFVQGGFYQDKLLGGGGTANYTISTPTLIYNGVSGTTLPGYAGWTTVGGEQDLVAKTLTISSLLIPCCVSGDSAHMCCHKIYCSGDITLNTGGAIAVDGAFTDNNYAVHTTAAPTTGYQPGSIGGSSGCTGSSAGDPTDPFKSLFYLGGAGGTGLGTGAGIGGLASFDRTGNNIFQPSVWMNGIAVTNFIEGLTKNTTAGPVISGMVFGGAGGGFAGTGVGTQAAGGAGAGCVWISCNKLILAGGSITANGQPSSNGGAGGGGFICILASEIIWSSSSSNIVAAGASSGVQQSGSGTILIMSNTFVGSVNGGISQSQYQTLVQQYQAR
jgi:hypothetical protein